MKKSTSWKILLCTTWQKFKRGRNYDQLSQGNLNGLTVSKIKLGLIIKRIKTTARYHFTPVRMAIIKKSTSNKYQTGSGEKGTLLYFWLVCKLMQPLWKTVWGFKLLQNIAEGGTRPNSFYEATITLIPKPKMSQRKKMTGQYH